MTGKNIHEFFFSGKKVRKQIPGKSTRKKAREKSTPQKIIRE